MNIISDVLRLVCDIAELHKTLERNGACGRDSPVRGEIFVAKIHKQIFQLRQERNMPLLRSLPLLGFGSTKMSRLRRWQCGALATGATALHTSLESNGGGWFDEDLSAK
jgi:hypothetical protein